MTPSTRGLTAIDTIYPFWGTFKRFRENPAAAFPAVAEPVHIYAAVLAVGALALAGGLLLSAVTLGAPLLSLAALAVIALLAERQSVRVASHTEMSVSVLPILFSAVVYGPLDAMIVGAFALSGDFRPPYVRWAVWTSQRALVAGTIGVVIAAMPGDKRFGSVLAAVAIAALTEAAMDGSLAVVTAAVRGNNIAETARSTFSVQLGSVPLYTPVLAVLV